MSHWARSLYERGLTPEQVLRECYGTDCPRELFVICENEPVRLSLPVNFTNQPWKLAVPLARGGPRPTSDSMEGFERKIFDRDPDLIPLALFLDSHAVHGGSLICYRLTELAAGRSAVFSIRRSLSDGDGIRPAGDSFLSALHAHHADLHRQLRRRLESPSNLGDGSIDETAVAEAQEWVDRIESLRRRVS